MSNADYSIDLPKLENIIEPNPLTISPQQSVLKAISKMNGGENHEISYSSYILAIEESKLIGILTDRDIIRLSAAEIDLAQVTVAEVMSPEVITVKKADFQDIYQAISILRLYPIRHLPVVDDEGKLAGIICSETIDNLVNISQLYEVIKTLKQELERLESKLVTNEAKMQAIGDGVITTDSLGNIQCFNLIAEQLTGWQTVEAKGLPLNAVFNIVDDSTRDVIANPVEQMLQDNVDYHLPTNTLLISRNKNEYAIEASAAPIRDRYGKIISVVMVFRDVTKSRQLAHKLSWQATRDTLTGLYKRKSFEAKLAEVIAKSSHQESNHILCCLDLDQFKIVNDTCGHEAGDELLRQVTTLLSQRIRDSDIFARLGGDKFGLLLHRCSLEMANSIANELRQLIEKFRFTWKGKVFKIGVSIGVVAIESNTEDTASLISLADAACCVAKDKGRNCVHIYHQQDCEVSKNRSEKQWVTRLNIALEENRFCLYAQKIIAIDNDVNIKHYEILLRFIDESGKLISPDSFIPAAERYNLMPMIDRWVISNFLTSYELYWQAKNQQILTYSKELYAINISGTSINSKQFRTFLQEQFTYHNIPPQTICFEITETAAISNLNNAASFIEELKELGCAIALDDFGSGMSSLSYLKKLPIDYLKIDGSFVKNIANDRIDYATVECFNNISQIMNIKTVAEFVENDEILQKIQNIGINYAQGYGIDKPQPLVFD
ncbi:MAG: EAL domain-containing protein [Xenococcus sp. MO_188.B8]|nr:EAL domain-containing protein [Xenococcus sp. MO_188.B8]